MDSSLHLCTLSYDIAWENPEKNFSALHAILESSPQADLWILPEMFSTGFSMNAKKASSAGIQSLHALQEWAKIFDTAFYTSFATEEEGKYYNRGAFITASDAYFYDKRHLFSYSGEDKIYTAGKEKVIVQYKGWRILLQICYDLRFPVFSRCNEDYDLCLYVANWPEQRIDAWNSLLKARAIENLCYLAGVNRTGTDGNGLQYPLSSAVYDYEGKKLTKGNAVAEYCTLDKKKLQDFREKYPFLKDRDAFRITYPDML